MQLRAPAEVKIADDFEQNIRRPVLTGIRANRKWLAAQPARPSLHCGQVIALEAAMAPAVRLRMMALVTGWESRAAV